MWYEHLGGTNNIIVSTRPDGIFRKGDIIKLRYKGAGVYKKTNLIDVIFTLEPDNPTSTEINHARTCGESYIGGQTGPFVRNYSAFFPNDTIKKAYFDRANFFDGTRYSHVFRPQVTYEFVYSGTNNHIETNSAWFSWGSLNNREGVNSNNAYTEYFKRSGALPNVWSIREGAIGSQGTFLYWDLFLSSSAFNYAQWGTTLPFLYNAGPSDFEDHIGTSTFWKSIGSMYCVSNTPGTFKFRMATPYFWFVPSMAALGPTAPEPEKKIIDGSELKEEVKRSPGGTVEFRVSQDVSEYGYYGSSYEKYASFSMEDALPPEVEYVNARVERSYEHAYNYNGSTGNVTSNGTLSYNNHTVKFVFNPSYLQSGMRYVGETYSLIITCRIKDSVRSDFTNQGKTTICGDEQKTNIVKVKVPNWKIETEVVNGTITNSEDKIPEGQDRTITYSPNTGYYLKQIVVDGSDVPIKDYFNSYSFINITQDHKIKVIYAKIPKITIQKQIDNSKVVYPKGTPEFFFLVTGTDYLGNSRSYRKYIGFTKSDTNKKQITFEIPAGVYTITEYGINDWQLLSCEAVLNGSVSGNSVVVDVVDNDSATAKFTNDISDYGNYTHNETKINRLK